MPYPLTSSPLFLTLRITLGVPFEAEKNPLNLNQVMLAEERVLR